MHLGLQHPLGKTWTWSSHQLWYLCEYQWVYGIAIKGHMVFFNNWMMQDPYCTAQIRTLVQTKYKSSFNLIFFTLQALCATEPTYYGSFCSISWLKCCRWKIWLVKWWKLKWCFLLVLAFDISWCIVKRLQDIWMSGQMPDCVNAYVQVFG